MRTQQDRLPSRRVENEAAGGHQLNVSTPNASPTYICTYSTLSRSSPVETIAGSNSTPTAPPK
jgi:hypothetical protein